MAVERLIILILRRRIHSNEITQKIFQQMIQVTSANPRADRSRYVRQRSQDQENKPRSTCSNGAGTALERHPYHYHIARGVSSGAISTKKKGIGFERISGRRILWMLYWWLINSMGRASTGDDCDCDNSCKENGSLVRATMMTNISWDRNIRITKVNNIEWKRNPC